LKNIKIIVTGANGQLGSEIRSLTSSFPAFQFTFVDIEEINLSEEHSIRSYFADRSFDFLINCAAYTAVDKAETESQTAKQVNVIAVKILSEIVLEKKMRMIHISTDYVFQGNGNAPISEEHNPNPLSVYGKTKLEGEKYVLQYVADAYIIRTAWVYSSFGKNFVKTIINLARERSELGIVADQIGSPTYANDLAMCILTIIESIVSKKKDQPGIYHYSNEGVISWYDFAYFINDHFGFNCKIKPIKTEEYKTLATRPVYSVLDKTKIKQTFGLEIPHWSMSLKACLARMKH
jgi:dTDP-4-dehydrorhamnose reductase